MSGVDGNGNVDNSDEEANKDTSENKNDDHDEEEDDLDKTEFENWVRGAMALKYLQQGLVPFVDREVAIRHNNYMQSPRLRPQTNVTCNCTIDNILPDHTGGSLSCNRQNVRKCHCYMHSKQNRRKCPHGICSKLYDFIVLDHRYNDPSWKNSHISDWTSNPWSIAKCFYPYTKCPSKSAKTTDAAGLLNIIINANFFQHSLNCNIDPPNDIISQARESRNEMIHKAQMKLSEKELTDYIDLFILILRDPHKLNKDPDANSAVNNLEKLKNNQIPIGTEEKSTILKNALKRLDEEKMAALADIETSESNALQTIQRAETEILKKLEKYEHDANVVADLEKRMKSTEEKMLTLTATRKDDESSKTEQTNNRTETDDEDARKDITNEPIELRPYQKELAAKGAEGHNVIVLAPTNTGKTRVACKIIQGHLQRKSQIGETGKVIFLVHTEPLAFQQGRQCAKLLPYYRTKVITGRVQREKNQLLKNFIERRDILVVTAQILLNALKLGQVTSLKEFSLIVIDECHHTTRSHTFNETMSRYIDMKLIDDVALPQIVGLTASLGVGGNTDHTAAKEYMKGLLVNMDAHYLSNVRANLAELREYANRAKEYTIITRKRPNDRYRDAILDVMNDIDVYMLNYPGMRLLPSGDDFIKRLCCVPLCRGSEQFTQWLSSLREGIAKLRDKDVITMLNQCRLHLEIYNKALMLHADARIYDAMTILTEFMKTMKPLKNDANVTLLRLYERLVSKNFDDVPENPKLEKMEKILTTYLTSKDSRCIIFANSLVLVNALKNWINEKESLRSLNAKEFVGRKKMSQLNQIDALEHFKNGHHRVIVATSVAEEGLDVTACNLVISYEHVKNEIVRLQSRGRARTKNSKYYVLTDEGSSLLEKEERNKMLEGVMDRIVPELCTYIEENPERWFCELKRLQEEKRVLEEKQELDILANMTNDVKRLHCLNCDKFICMSSDVRIIQGGYRIPINEDVLKRLILIRSPEPEYEDKDVKSDGQINCSDCYSTLGGVFEYRETEFPSIKIKHFRVIDCSDKRKNFKKWKKVNFKVDQMSLNELDQIVQIRVQQTVS